jgi:hypothetical protein
LCVLQGEKKEEELSEEDKVLKESLELAGSV